MSFDPLGTIINELRDDPAVAALVGGRVRGAEPMPRRVNAAGAVLEEGDVVKGYQRFVVIGRLGTVRHPRRVLQEVRLSMNCYAANWQDASVLTGAAADALHDVGPRFGTGNGAIYISHVETEGDPEKDPATGQPFETSVIALITTIEPLEGS